MAATTTGAAASAAAAAASGGETYDPVQVKLMEELIIVVDENDVVLRSGTKKECHLSANIMKDRLLHRAFSVFLFNPEGKLLIQQRSPSKITFPLYWANSCCSHPLFTREEMELENSLGVKRAAIRKLNHELGIPTEQLPIEDFHHLTTIHYLALDEGIWGEHEIDHVLVIQTKENVDLSNIEPNEVNTVRYMDEDELFAFINASEKSSTANNKCSPWFVKIARTFLHDWWALVRQEGGIPKKAHEFALAKSRGTALISRL